MANYATLREANTARQAEWDPGNAAANVDWRMNELAGETGEACNVLKKLHRERAGVPGPRTTKDDLADEIADVVICTDLLLMQGGYPEVLLRAAAYADYDDLTMVGVKLYMAVSRLFTVFPFGDQGEIHERARSVYRVCHSLALREGIALEMAVAKKFNETTRKMNLTTFYRPEMRAVAE